MSSYNTLLTEFHEGIFTLTFNRPKANALNGEMALETLAALRVPPPTPRCVWL